MGDDGEVPHYYELIEDERDDGKIDSYWERRERNDWEGIRRVCSREE